MKEDHGIITYMKGEHVRCPKGGRVMDVASNNLRISFDIPSSRAESLKCPKCRVGFHTVYIH
ncbi:hypothetical protein [Eubacterium sp. MSJ-33]|uniref:hypothetical protein n=1 Tax=Eubacterium sp. MSJ-33 TaxID=2841528 RepID=UPI001C77865E|nr:hypothetical protein [Eubacterium sp. MSJ-33]QWT53028.1 hypothetical protein KP625_13400 [Eubacterium sp. MSJ-33]